MTTLSPAHSHAFWLLRNEIYGHLDSAEFLAMDSDAWRDAETTSARKLICDLVTVIRTVVAQHEDDTTGRCRFCHAPWPCRSIQSIHQVLKDPAREFTLLTS
ncbi:hypothetical protein [Amycolatopsis anabasis]|uniref:hypothetical protein n=1 Tax=Amycolatopsis anabasis TaxID=1840409 RepID=UPI0015D3B7AE|nr:hypothetical protein [Amycolatopsis anabasis]